MLNFRVRRVKNGSNKDGKRRMRRAQSCLKSSAIQNNPDGADLCWLVRTI